jgi:hypothetical protein
MAYGLAAEDKKFYYTQVESKGKTGYSTKKAASENNSIQSVKARKQRSLRVFRHYQKYKKW